jgi:8-oxo-dGTP pyrophosphatase MutT (NUDIX family)
MKIINVAKSLIFNPEGKVLLLTRSGTDPHAPLRLDLPGGGVGPGEDIAVGASREVYEESGIQIPASQYKLMYTGTSQGYPGESVNRFLFIAHSRTSDARLSHEHSKYEWVSLDEIIKRFDHPFYGPAMRFVADNKLYVI